MVKASHELNHKEIAINWNLKKFNYRIKWYLEGLKMVRTNYDNKLRIQQVWNTMVRTTNMKIMAKTLINIRRIKGNDHARFSNCEAWLAVLLTLGLVPKWLVFFKIPRLLFQMVIEIKRLINQLKSFLEWSLFSFKIFN